MPPILRPPWFLNAIVRVGASLVVLQSAGCTLDADFSLSAPPTSKGGSNSPTGDSGAMISSGGAEPQPEDASMRPGPGVDASPGATSAGVDASAPLEDPPNVVLIVTDDQGYGDLGVHGNPVLKTPAIDELARQSVQLTDYHAAPSCAPTRASLQTGLWANRTGVWHTVQGRSLLREGLVTIGDAFSSAGYETGLFGKWHLGDNYPFRPEDRGYTHVFRHGGAGVGQTPDHWDNAYFDGSYLSNGQLEAVDGFCTNVWFERAQRFIAEQKQASKPFLAYIATNAPAAPFHSPAEASAPYQDLPGSTPNFLGMIANIDEQVGALRKFLEDEGLAENTIFIFTTDNGSHSVGASVFNAGMQGSFGSAFDGGHRVPFFLHWPKGGFDSEQQVEPITGAVDVLPTLLDLAGVEGPEGVEFDGVSLRPLLEGQTEDWPDRILVVDNQRVEDPVKWRGTSVMTSQWRLVNGDQLYDIDADPGQVMNIAADHPAVMQRLTAFYDAWWDELSPGFEAPARIVLGHAKDNPGLLTAHDWFGDGPAPPWNQQLIRLGPATSGSWEVRLEVTGTYRFSLRRWPPEVSLPATQGLPSGENVAGVNPYRMTEGNALPIARAVLDIAGERVEADLPIGAEQAEFELDLPAGDATLNATFFTTTGELAGPYYVSVEAL